MKENDVFTLEDDSDICFETNINRLGGSSAHGELYADVYRNESNGRPRLLESFKGRHAVTRAVTYIGGIKGEPVAYRVRRQPSSEVWL